MHWHRITCSFHTGCICVIDCSACSVLQRVTVHNKDISSVCCIAVAADACTHVVMASACKAGVVAVTVLGGSSCSLNSFKSKVQPAFFFHFPSRHVARTGTWRRRSTETVGCSCTRCLPCSRWSAAVTLRRRCWGIVLLQSSIAQQQRL